MAKPRVFISSTFYDLKQIRNDLDKFINDMGYEAVRNETGKIPYGKEERPEEYCYREISSIEMLIGIVGGKFGTISERKLPYSITQIEIKTAIEQNKQVYIFVEKNVLSEYRTYLLNKESSGVNYYFADDIRIYSFLEELHSLPKNNIIQPFDDVNDIVSFLKEQWAGLFRELLIQNSEKFLYTNVSLKVNELTEVTTTLKTYLEEVLENVEKEKGKATELIQKEKERLSIFYRGKVVKDEFGLSYFIDKAGIYHILPDKETAGFFESNEGQINIKRKELESNYEEGNAIDSVLKESSKLVWVDKTHIFIILNGKRYHVPSWDHLFSWKRNDKGKFIDISSDELQNIYPEGR